MRLALPALAAALVLAVPAFAQNRSEASRDYKLAVDTVASGLVNPWGLAFLADGRMLVTERPGRLRIATADGTLSEPLRGVPEVVAQGQGGLLDVVLGPDFATSRLVYLSYSEPGEGGTSGTAVARGRLAADGTALENVQVIFRQLPKVASRGHFGSRLVFAPDGRLFVTLGERQSFKERAQDLSYHFGKVVRIEPDGKVPADNPFAGREDARPEIWSYGHRNPQSAGLHPATGELWIVEHGARGGDEVNVPQAGKNYGWPVISYGVDYSGAKIGEGRAKTGMEQPIYYWDPSIAPSGFLFYTGDLFPKWKGDLFVGALAGKLLSRLDVNGEKIGGEERLLKGLGERIRDVRQGPDGAIYLLTDAANGRILRLRPAG